MVTLLSRTYKIVATPENINRVWNNSSIDERKKLLRSAGICDKEMIKQLVNNNYVQLDPDVRFELECS